MARIRTLIVNNDPEQRKQLATALRQDFEGAAARNGLDALHKVSFLEPDLVIVAWDMPVMNGEEFLRRLRVIPGYEDTLVVFTTAASHAAEFGSVTLRHALFYLHDLADTAEFNQYLVNTVMQRRIEPRAKTYSFDQLLQMSRKGAEPPPPEAPPTVEKTEGKRPAAHEPAAGRPPAAKGPTGRQAAVLTPTLHDDHHFDGIAHKPRGERKASKPRILIVDDDKDILRVLQLELFDRATVFTANNGLEAVEKAMKSQPDIFLIDWMMPKLSGGQLVRILRDSARFATTPVLIITAKNMSRSESALRRLRVDDVIFKPVDFRLLWSRIRHHLADSGLDLGPEAVDRKAHK